MKAFARTVSLSVASVAAMASMTGVATAQEQQTPHQTDGVCAIGEICFAQNVAGGGGRIEFWYNAFHYTYYYDNGDNLYRSASSLWNRDTMCDVWVYENYDWDNNAFWFSNKDAYYYDFTASWLEDLNDENASHTRCKKDSGRY